MNKRVLGWTVVAVSSVITVAWNIEAWTVGRGFVSTYLAPVAIVGPLLGAWLLSQARREAPKADGPRAPRS